MSGSTRMPWSAAGSMVGAVREASARARPVTIISPCRPGWSLWLRFVGLYARASRRVGVALGREGTVRAMPVIHFAHWDVVSRVPQRRGKRMRRAHVLFQSNFNGDLNAYIDMFAILVPSRMWLLWGGCYGFPGPLPTGPFKEYIANRAHVDGDHFFHAYPETSVRQVKNALVVHDELAALARRTRKATDEEFAAAWERFLCDVQDRL